MDNTNGIVVAGGDGALSEVVTGLLRRNDSDLAAKTYPIGIIPVGRVNSVAQALYKDYRSIDRTKSYFGISKEHIFGLQVTGYT